MSHTPMTIEQLTKLLKSKGKNKEVIVNVAFNDYDIIAVKDDKGVVVLQLKHIAYRTEEDDGKIVG